MSWSPNKYLSKAQSYWDKATSLERDSEDFLLSVSFFCEFVVRGCLVHINPILNASTDEESILFAAGISPNRPPRSIDIGTAVNRIARLIPEIAEEEIKTVDALFQARNTELHGDTSEIANIQSKDILPKLYSFVVKLLRHIGRDPADILGRDDAAHAVRIAEAVLKDRKRRVSDLIRVQKERFFTLSEADQAAKRDAVKLSFVSAVTRDGRHVLARKCPACAAMGLLAGQPVGRSAPILREDGIVEEIRAAPEAFTCKCCDLSIIGLDELMAAGFPHEFYTIDNKDPVDHFGINPLDYVDTEQIIREYHESEYAYQDE